VNRTRPEVEQHGFSIVPGMFAQDQTKEIIRDLERSELRRTKAGIRHALRHEPIRQLAAEPRLLNVAREILDHEATSFRATLFDKSPQANWLVVWHQDTALPLRQRHDAPGWGPWSVKDGIAYAHAPATALSKVLAIRIHLDDSNADNGPLRVLPGSHAKGVLSDDAIEALVQQTSAVDCLVPQGGALVMSPLIVHASSKTKSQVPRRVIHIEYSASTRFDGSLELAIT
jgi:ectoine hydroxylase-related dioxygenase (phytanoyl-CoA dioxygenase family)